MQDGFDIGQSLENGLDKVFEYLPQVLAAIIILIFGYIIALILKKLTRNVLQKLRFDRAMHTSPAGRYIDRLVETPSRFVARVVFWVVWLGMISLAVSALNLPALNAFVAAIYGYLPNVIAAVLIFLVASAISAGGAAFIQRVMGNTPTARLLKTIIPFVTLSIATFMILNQLRIATDIVNITYIAITGSFALGLALAFGLGGRDVAARILDQAYESSQKNAEQAKRDITRAKENTKQEVSTRVKQAGSRRSATR